MINKRAYVSTSFSQNLNDIDKNKYYFNDKIKNFDGSELSNDNNFVSSLQNEDFDNNQLIQCFVNPNFILNENALYGDRYQ
jgi:hypothetical protein